MNTTLDNNRDTPSSLLICWFDLETNLPGPHNDPVEIFEYACLFTDAVTMREVVGQQFETLIRTDVLMNRKQRTNRLTSVQMKSLSAPTFRDVADKIFHLMNGKIWAGYNIAKFDIQHLKNAFRRVQMNPPQPVYVIDAYAVLNRNRAFFEGIVGSENLKLDSLAKCFGFGEQKHEAFDDIRLTIKVFERASALLLLKQNSLHVASTAVEDEDKTAKKRSYGKKKDLDATSGMSSSSSSSSRSSTVSSVTATSIMEEAHYFTNDEELERIMLRLAIEDSESLLSKLSQPQSK